MNVLHDMGPGPPEKNKSKWFESLGPQGILKSVVEQIEQFFRDEKKNEHTIV